MSKRCASCGDCGTSAAYMFRGSYRCAECVDRVIEAEPSYQAELEEALGGAFTASEEGRTSILDATERRRWLREVADRALED